MSTTERLKMPLITPGQAQKETAHNEALAALDMLVCGYVEGPLNDPPAAPSAGDCYIVGDAPTGAWADQAGSVAGWTAGGWRHVAAVEGMRLTMRGSGVVAAFRDGGWEIGSVRADAVLIAGSKVLGQQAAAIAGPAGGTTVDAQARVAIGEILGALRGHGLIAG